MPYKIKRTKKRTKIKKQKGGGVGTSGSFDTLISDITELATQTITTVTDTADLIDYVMNIDTDLGQTYSPTEVNAPGNNLTTVT
jgi:hypothetical protein